MVFSHDFYVGFKSIDKNLKLSNNGILTLFTDIAGMHSEFCGDSFFNSNSRWLVLGYDVKIFDRPLFASTVTVSTWSSEVDNLTAHREFEIKDKSGKLLICGKSKWVGVNAETKRIERINKEKMALYNSEPERTNFNSNPIGKLNEPDSYNGESVLNIDFKWIDINNHLNNTYYVDIAKRSLPEYLQQQLENMNFEVMYKKEVYEGQTIKSLYNISENEIIVSIKSENNSTLHSIVRFYK